MCMCVQTDEGKVHTSTAIIVTRVVHFVFVGSKGLIQFVKIVEPSNCLSGLMCGFGIGVFCWLPTF